MNSPHIPCGNMAGVKTYTEVQKEDMTIKKASLAVSVASLAVSVAALCLNEKPESKNTFKKEEDRMTPSKSNSKSEMKAEKQRARDIKMAKKVVQARVENDIKAKAVEQGMKTMREDGINQILEGVTTVTEVLQYTIF